MGFLKSMIDVGPGRDGQGIEPNQTAEGGKGMETSSPRLLAWGIVGYLKRAEGFVPSENLEILFGVDGRTIRTAVEWARNSGDPQWAFILSSVRGYRWSPSREEFKSFFAEHRAHARSVLRYCDCIDGAFSLVKNPMEAV